MILLLRSHLVRASPFSCGGAVMDRVETCSPNNMVLDNLLTKPKEKQRPLTPESFLPEFSFFFHSFIILSKSEIGIQPTVVILTSTHLLQRLGFIFCVSLWEGGVDAIVWGATTQIKEDSVQCHHLIPLKNKTYVSPWEDSVPFSTWLIEVR